VEFDNRARRNPLRERVACRRKRRLIPNTTGEGLRYGHDDMTRNGTATFEIDTHAVIVLADGANHGFELNEISELLGDSLTDPVCASDHP
jgi:hypothetical protein